jgi:hypothetical protein
MISKAEAQAGALEEIVVTARKREESLQDTPISIAAFTTQDLEARGIVDFSELGEFTPNVTFDFTSAISGGNSAAIIMIRGVGTSDWALPVDPGVGLYLDGVYIARTVGQVMDTVDVERIEVLRGPQGTLFGRNTIGGAISVALLLGGLTGFIPALMGQWPSRFIMLLIGSVIIAVSMLLLMRPMTALSVTFALVLLNSGWNLTVAYGSANVAESDGSGFLLPMLPAAISVAAMLAPAVGGRLLEFGGNGLFLGFVTVVLMIAQGLFLYAAYLSDPPRS